FSLADGRWFRRAWNGTRRRRRFRQWENAQTTFSRGAADLYPLVSRTRGMTLLKWWRKLATSSRRPAPRRRARPVVESLEGRIVPSIPVVQQIGPDSAFGPHHDDGSNRLDINIGPGHAVTAGDSIIVQLAVRVEDDDHDEDFYNWCGDHNDDDHHGNDDHD